jgi:hypothetical protein
MSKQILADEIAQDLLDFSLLDEANYNGDTVGLLQDVTEKIMYRLRDFHILQGEVF